MKCLVSGATGFLGRQLCQQLTARGDEVIALSKSGAPLDSGEPTVAIDLAIDDPAEGLFRGVDVFFHLAGIAHRKERESAYDELNHRATVRLARLASEAGVKCFIFVSSVKAMGPPPPACSAPRSENSGARPPDAYGLSKWHAERALQEQFRDDGMSVAIVRPALVYGTNVKGNLQNLARAVRFGLPRPPSVGSRSMIALEDIVELLCIIARHPPPPGVRTWIACGAESYSLQAVYDLLRKACGKGRGVAWFPGWAWRASARLLDMATGRRNDSTYDKLFGTEVYSNAAVVRDTGWQPRIRLEDVASQISGAGGADP